MSEKAPASWDLGGLVYRPVEKPDAALLSPLNNEAYPAVPLTDEAEMAALIDLSSWGVVALGQGEPIGFVLCVEPGVNYDSENYRFFESQFTSHFYIDRIVISGAHRGSGLGSALYGQVFSHASSRGFDYVTCEVNLDPPNPQSVVFHRRHGFREVGTQATKGGSVVVSLLAAEVDTSE